MTDGLVRTLEQDNPPSQTKDQLESTSSTLTDAKLLHIQCCRRGSKEGRGCRVRGGQAHCDSGANESPAQASGGETTLTGVSRNNGGEFGAVELYCRRDTEWC